jgi:hypothetical protein
MVRIHPALTRQTAAHALMLPGATMSWAECAEVSRRLADVRGQEAARQTQSHQQAASGRATVEQLKRRLSAQRDHLAGVAMGLGEPQPSFDGAARTGLNDVDEAIRRAWSTIDQADAEARQSEERGMRPVLFPACRRPVAMCWSTRRRPGACGWSRAGCTP